MSRRAAPLCLLADIGGTHARFALARPDGGVDAVRVLRASDHRGLAEAAEAYLAGTGEKRRPATGAFAVASPVTGDRIHFTNSPWSFSIRALKRRLGLADLAVINDFLAVALAVPALGARQLCKVGPGRRIAGAPVAVMGPGTGLGVSLLVPDGERWVAVATEGGHVSLPAADAGDETVITALRHRFGHVSAERVLSGPGLVNLYDAVCALAGKRAQLTEPADIAARALDGTDRLAAETLVRFCALLGTVAGDLALSTGARGGLFIAGGIVPGMTDYLKTSPFRDRFEAKGRFRDYLAAIPTYVITHRQPAFLGLAGLAGTGS
jgi:glucokinase